MTDCSTLTFDEPEVPTAPRPVFMTAVVAAGRTDELLDALQLAGSPGFMGRGTYSTEGREAGYRRT